MVLWKKESTSTDACYIDLLTDTELENSRYKFSKWMSEHTNKNAAKSTERRMRGNLEFKAKHWEEAMEMYNQSLRYAAVGSENISLAYANRSLCFFQLQKYDQCLADIELAKKANYPVRLMHKLQEREAVCLKLLSDESTKKPKVPTKPVLSFDAHEKFPCLANVLEIQYDAQFKKHIMAKCDIDVGQIVMVDEMYITNLHSEDQTFCKTCLKSDMNFIACRSCSDVMFCDENCMASNSIHEMTCNVLHGQKVEYARVVNSILLAVNAFPNVAALIEFVKMALATHDYETPECESDEQKKYRAFLKLDYLTDVTVEEWKPIVFQSYQLLMEIPVMKERFRLKHEQRFLMHLILQHNYIFFSNSLLFKEVDFVDAEKRYEVSGTCLFQSLLNHLCVANVAFQRHGNKMYVFAIRPVKQGEELLMASGKEQLDNQCNCTKCVPIWKQADLDRMKAEQDFQDVMTLQYKRF